MEAWTAHIDQLRQGLVWFLGDGSAPWLILLMLLIARPPALRELILARQAAHTRRYRHLLNLTCFRGAVAKREQAEHRPRRGHRP